jgi:hypothetical protein
MKATKLHSQFTIGAEATTEQVSFMVGLFFQRTAYSKNALVLKVFYEGT